MGSGFGMERDTKTKQNFLKFQLIMKDPTTY